MAQICRPWNRGDGPPELRRRPYQQGPGHLLHVRQVAWHHKVPTPTQYRQALAELEEAAVMNAPFPPCCTTAATPSSPCSSGWAPRTRVSSRCATIRSARPSSAGSARFPDRLVNVGIAEQNMVGVGAGLANGGKLPFVCAASPFLTGRALEQIKADVAYTLTNVKLVGISSGMAYGELGPTHHSIEDFAWIRALPNIPVIAPADRIETAAAVRWAAAHEGPCFLRLSRVGVPDLLPEDHVFVMGRANLLRDGRDLTIVANGTLTHRALQAAVILLGHGGSRRGCSTWPRSAPSTATRWCAAAEETGAILTCEEHTVFGGLGSAVAEVVVETCAGADEDPGGARRLRADRIGELPARRVRHGARGHRRQRGGLLAGASADHVRRPSSSPSTKAPRTPRRSSCPGRRDRCAPGRRPFPSPTPAPAGSNRTPRRSGRRCWRRSPPAWQRRPTPDITALGISNQRESVLIWDRQTGAPLGPVLSWQCRRTAADCAALRAAGPRARVIARTGLPIDPMFPPTKAAWLLGVTARAQRRLPRHHRQLADLAPHRRARPRDRPLERRAHQLFDLRIEDRWDADLCALFGVPGRRCRRCTIRPMSSALSRGAGAARRVAHRRRHRRFPRRALRPRRLHPGRREGDLRHRIVDHDDAARPSASRPRASRRPSPGRWGAAHLRLRRQHPRERRDPALGRRDAGPRRCRGASRTC
jgi:transketolase